MAQEVAGSIPVAHPNSPNRTRQSPRTTRTTTIWIVALAALFAFRLLFGLSSEFFFEDETQIFLMGLKYYATSQWPYFGPDVVWTRSEIPGALQGLLVGLPLKIVAAPEASYVLLNLLSMAALAVFAWYLARRFPAFPRWLLWGWLMTTPWTIQFSTHLLNPSWVLPASIAFFIGFFEVVPAFSLGLVPRPLSFLLMGAAITWIAQLHMSWPLLLPYAGLAWLLGWRRGARSIAIDSSAFAIGLLITGATLIPTLIVYGGGTGSGGVLRNIRVHVLNPATFVTILARFFSFASLEIARFIATNNAKRLMFFVDHLWLAPLAAAAWAIGIWQPIWMTREWFRRRSPYPEWPAVRWLVALTLVLLYASFWFVMEPAQAHSFYPLAPIAFLFAAYCWTFVDSPRWRRVAAAVLAINIAFHAGLAWAQAPARSLYKNREVVATAVRLKEPEMIGHRRPFAIGGEPFVLKDPSRPFDILRDVGFADVAHGTNAFGVAMWTVTVRNRNERVAFRDILYQTTYRDREGTVVDRRHEYIKDIFQPGDTRGVTINDGFFDQPYATASIEVLSAEALVPMPAGDPER